MAVSKERLNLFGIAAFPGDAAALANFDESIAGRENGKCATPRGVFDYLRQVRKIDLAAMDASLVSGGTFTTPWGGTRVSIGVNGTPGSSAKVRSNRLFTYYDGVTGNDQVDFSKPMTFIVRFVLNSDIPAGVTFRAGLLDHLGAIGRPTNSAVCFELVEDNRLWLIARNGSVDTIHDTGINLTAGLSIWVEVTYLPTGEIIVRVPNGEDSVNVGQLAQARCGFRMEMQQAGATAYSITEIFRNVDIIGG